MEKPSISNNNSKRPICTLESERLNISTQLSRKLFMSNFNQQTSRRVYNNERKFIGNATTKRKYKGH